MITQTKTLSLSHLNRLRSFQGQSLIGQDFVYERLVLPGRAVVDECQGEKAVFVRRAHRPGSHCLLMHKFLEAVQAVLTPVSSSRGLHT